MNNETILAPEKIEEVTVTIQDICNEWYDIVQEHINKNAKESADSINDYVREKDFEAIFEREIEAVITDITDYVKVRHVLIGAYGDRPYVEAQYYVELAYTDGTHRICTNKEL